jgi:hypothetical protein
VQEWRQQQKQLTFLQVLTQIDDFAADGWDEKISNFFLGAIIAAHEDDELRLVRRWRCTEDWARDQTCVGRTADQGVEFACQISARYMRQFKQRAPAKAGYILQGREREIGCQG